MKFRFVFKSDAVNHFEGVGVDNFTVSVIDDKQLKINSVIAPLELPTYECGLSGKEKVKVSLLNIGSSTIDSLKLSYQIESRPKVVQWFYGLLKADSIKSFEFTEKANLFTRKIYRLKIFLEYEKTSITGYDTITRFINNEYYVQKTAPYFENFDEMTPISRFIFPFTPPIDSLSIEWSRDPKLIDRKEYTWVVASDTAYNSRIGPIKDNTGNNGNYLYSVNISNTTVNSEAKVSSPCILINSQNAELSFWYHRTNVYEASYIDIYENGAWNLSVDTISAAIPAVNTDSFKQKIFDLSEYESQKIKIRFTIGTPVGIQQMAIDDFHIYDSSAINERFLQTPIKGVYGQDYALVNYVDWIGTGYQDAYCGTKSYDGHEGTDFTLRSFRQMDSGVYVLAADTGIVTFVKDSLFDREKVSDPAKGLGNYIAIKHPNDFYTYYGHLKKYSLLVNVGDTVSASQRIAEVGSSGNSTDPHLHFELWYDSLYVVDPFSGDCGNDSTLWINPLPYDTILTVWESGLYLKNIGIDNLRERDTTSICCPYELTNQGDTLSYWSHLLGLRTGDTLTIDWLDSAATNQFSYDFVMQQDWWYYYFWSYITTQNISIGDWQVFLSRNSEVIDSLNFEVKLNPITQLKEVSIKTTNCEPIASLGQEELILLDQRNQLEVFNLKGQRIQSPSKFLGTKPEPSISSIYIVRIISAEQDCIYKVLR